jgi:hypothetical protein
MLLVTRPRPMDEGSDYREQVSYKVHAHGALTMSVIARELGLPICCWSRLITRTEDAKTVPYRWLVI